MRQKKIGLHELLCIEKVKSGTVSLASGQVGWLNVSAPDSKAALMSSNPAGLAV